MFRESILTIAALAAVSAPLAVQAAPAPATVATRTAAPADAAEQLRGTGLWIVAAIVAAALIWGAIEIFDKDDEAFPVSP